jgi:hypothetical protein
MGKYSRYLFFCFIFCAVSFSVSADPLEPRSQSLGCSTYADNNAFYANPAALIHVTALAIQSTYADCWNSGTVKSNYQILYPVKDKVGLGFYFGETSDDELDFKERQISLSASIKLMSQLSVGSRFTKTNINSIFTGSGSSIEIAGILGPFNAKSAALSLGFYSKAYDYLELSTGYIQSINDWAVGGKIERGATGFLISYHSRDNMAFGLEYTGLSGLDIRAGLNQQSVSLGLGISYKPFEFNYTYILSQLDSQHLLAIEWRYF